LSVGIEPIKSSKLQGGSSSSFWRKRLSLLSSSATDAAERERERGEDGEEPLQIASRTMEGKGEGGRKGKVPNAFDATLYYPKSLQGVQI
jgi:hypothetical protein